MKSNVGKVFDTSWTVFDATFYAKRPSKPRMHELTLISFVTIREFVAKEKNNLSTSFNHIRRLYLYIQCTAKWMKEFDWNLEKNRQLKEERGVGFEEVVYEISTGNLLEVLDHPNQEKYPNQKIFIVVINDYVCYVPFVETEKHYFLKTIIPSRKLNKKYKG